MMKITNKNLKIKILHNSRFWKFRTYKGSVEKKYFDPKIPAILTFVLTIIIFTALFFFTDYKETVLKIGIFAVLFNLYKMYKVFFQPCLIINDKGIEFQSARFNWENIKKVYVSFNLSNKNLNFQILSNQNKTATEKVENFLFEDSASIVNTIRTFKKKHRKPYAFPFKVKNNK